MAFTLKAIRDKFNERIAQWIGIDDFDTVKGKKTISLALGYMMSIKTYLVAKKMLTHF